VTHRDLFLENPVKLPFLNVDLPLRNFFWLGPALLLLMYTYVLLHFVVLSRKVAAFDAELRLQISSVEDQNRERRRLPNNIFAQFLAGSGEVRDSSVGVLLWLVALVSLVIAPILLLVFFQLEFLPYHQTSIIWWQRFAVTIGLLVVWKLWPAIGLRNVGMTDEDERQRRVELFQRYGTIATMVLITIASITLSLTVATFPGEWLDTHLPRLRFIPYRQSLPADASRWEWTSLSELLIEGDVDPARKPRSIWSNRLVLPGMDIIDHAKFESEAKIAAIPELASLRNRNLEGAILIGAVLRKVDFTGARLTGASLQDAVLQEAILSNADLTNARLNGAVLNGGKMQKASLEGADFSKAHLENVDLTEAHFSRLSRLDSAFFQHATLLGVKFEGASLKGANLTGAVIGLANFSGSNLTAANLSAVQGGKIDFSTSNIDFGILDNATIYGSKLDRASLCGTSLSGAHIIASSLERAVLVGTDLSDAVLEADNLDGVALDHALAAGTSFRASSMNGGVGIRSTMPPDDSRLEAIRKDDRFTLNDGRCKFEISDLPTPKDRRRANIRMDLLLHEGTDEPATDKWTESEEAWGKGGSYT